MDKKTRKAQVVIAAVDHERQSFDFLLMQTNERRGHFWQNVTGKIDAGETFEEGALRETIEETGLQIELIVDLVDLNLVHEFVDQRKRDVIERSFLIVVDRKFEVKIDPHEHENHRWLALAAINEDVVKYKGNFEALKKAIHLLRHWRT